MLFIMVIISIYYSPQAKVNGIWNLPQFVITAADDPATFRRCESKGIGAKSVLTVVE